MSTERPSLPGGLSLVELADYLLDVGATLSAYGNPTHRTESVVRLIAESEGASCEVFAVPTGLWLSVRLPGGLPTVRMARVKEWSVNLDRLAEVDRIFNEVVEDRLSLLDARAAIAEVERRPAPYYPALQQVSHVGASVAAAVFFRGGPWEMLFAACGATLLAVLSRLLRARAGGPLLRDFVGGVVAASIAWAATRSNPTLSREAIVLSIIIVLIPGMSLTSGLAELANRNLVSGAGRLMEALIIFLLMLFGIACVVAVEASLSPTLATTALPLPLPALWLQLLALGVAAPCFSILFSVPHRYMWQSIASGALGWAVATQTGRTLPGSVAAFAGALSVMLWANGCARVTKRPAQVFLLPGLILLVPGSVGFLSLEAFLRGEFLGGATRAFEMFLVAGAIVTAILLANVILPAKKIL